MSVLLPRRHVLLGLMAAGILVQPASLRAQVAVAGSSGAGILADLRRMFPDTATVPPIFVQGALTPNDEGGGWFAWRAASQAADDNGCVVAPDGAKAGRWHRLYSGPVDVRWFGARGDGQTDDAGALQQAIDHHVEIHVPAGVYRLTQPLDFTGAWGRRLSGAGQTADPNSPGGFEKGGLSRASTLLLDADDAPVIRLAGSGHLIERLYLMARTPQPRSAEGSYGVELDNVSRSRLTDLRIFNCATGIGIPQKAAKGSRYNAIFDVAFQNIDINRFSKCGFDLRNFNGGGTGVALSQIYMNNSKDGKVGGDVYDGEHFILGKNWAEYVLDTVHCEWTNARQTPIVLYNCNASVSGLHFEGVKFESGLATVIQLEGGITGLELSTVQFYDCSVKGAPSAAPLAILSSGAATARTRLTSLRIADNVLSENGRRLTPGAIVAGRDSKMAISGVMNASPAYVTPRKTNGLTIDE